MSETPLETRRDRRQKRRGGGVGGPVVAAAAAVAALALGGAAYAALGGHDDGHSSAASSASTSAADASASSSVTSDAGGADSPFVAQCRTESKAATTLATSLVGVADDWRVHTTALTDYEAGKITLDKAKEDWAKSKMAGPGHLKSYDDAVASYDKAKGACAKAADGGELDATAAKNCTERADAATTLAKDGKAVAEQWQKHVDNMKHKQHIDAVKYDKEWRDQVTAAPPKLQAYDKAAAAFDKTAACTA